MVKRFGAPGGSFNINLQVFDRARLPNKVSEVERTQSPVPAIADLSFG